LRAAEIDAGVAARAGPGRATAMTAVADLARAARDSAAAAVPGIGRGERAGPAAADGARRTDAQPVRAAGAARAGPPACAAVL